MCDQMIQSEYWTFLGVRYVTKAEEIQLVNNCTSIHPDDSDDSPLSVSSHLMINYEAVATT